MAEIAGVDLNKKIGPVPTWVFVLAGGLALAYFVNRSFLGSGSTGTSVVESGVGGTPGGFVPAPRPDEIPEPDTGPLDNEAWAFLAVTFLIGKGYNPIESGIAVRKYLDGESVSSRELTMITVVSRKPPDGIGPPPNIPVGGGVIVPPTQPPPSTPPPKPKGKWLLIPAHFGRRDAKGNHYGVLDQVMKTNGYRLGVVDIPGRTSIWWHANNNALRAKYRNDWSKLRTGETIWIVFR